MVKSTVYHKFDTSSTTMMELKCQIANQVKLNAILCLSISLLKLQPKVIQTLGRVTLLESRTELCLL